MGGSAGKIALGMYDEFDTHVHDVIEEAELIEFAQVAEVKGVTKPFIDGLRKCTGEDPRAPPESLEDLVQIAQLGSCQKRLELAGGLEKLLSFVPIVDHREDFEDFCFVHELKTGHMARLRRYLNRLYSLDKLNNPDPEPVIEVEEPDWMRKARGVNMSMKKAAALKKAADAKRAEEDKKRAEKPKEKKFLKPDGCGFVAKSKIDAFLKEFKASDEDAKNILKTINRRAIKKLPSSAEAKFVPVEDRARWMNNQRHAYLETLGGAFAAYDARDPFEDLLSYDKDVPRITYGSN